MTFLQFLNQRYQLAKKHTKDFHENTKDALRDFDPGDGYQPLGKKTGVYDKHVATQKFELKIPYIFATHESMLASIFERMPEILITGRAGSDPNKVSILKALYSYYEDKLDLDEFINDSAWWLLLVGFVVGTYDYKITEGEYIPQLDSEGNPMVDEMGEPVLIPTYTYHDPVVKVDNLLKAHFAPDSEFSISADKVPYYVCEELVECEELEDTYGVEVEADEKLDVEGLDSKEDLEDLDRCKLMKYYGRIPGKYKNDLRKQKLEWSFKQEYKIYFVKEKILYAAAIDSKQCKLARMYAKHNEFFGFGISKTLKPFQDEMSVRRGQMVRYGDLFAYPWLMLPNGVKVSQRDILDRYKRNPLAVTGERMPEYLTPPQMPSVIEQADQASRSDAQFVSGTLDLSKGAQQTNTVKTATGQQLFAQSQDKRLQKVRKSLSKYYREIVIGIFKIARDNWQDEKEIHYYDENNQYQTMVITREDLEGIDFDTDVDFNLDSVSVNKDIMSQRWISLLETSGNLPGVKSEMIAEKVLRESFGIPNPELYIKTPEEMAAEAQAQQPGGEQPPATPGQMPVENPQQVPGQQPLGSQLAPQVPNAGI